MPDQAEDGDVTGHCTLCGAPVIYAYRFPNDSGVRALVVPHKPGCTFDEGCEEVRVANPVQCGRNQPCTCGSRKKFKYCCGR